MVNMDCKPLKNKEQGSSGNNNNNKRELQPNPNTLYCKTVMRFMKQQATQIDETPSKPFFLLIIRLI